jgi:16S rRNA (adenine(1408)-N(1))-methyltransferase
VAGRYVRLVLDLGTGDGAAVIRRARREAATLVVGVDPNADAMRVASRGAARPPAKGGLPNALFVVAAAEHLPAELDGRFHELHVTLPWGSLLRAAVCAEPWLMEAAQGLVRPGGELHMLLSVTERDAATGLPMLDTESVGELAAAWAAGGFEPGEVRRATAEDVRATGSSWARRLDIPRRRHAWRLRLRRREGPAAGTSGRGADVLGPTPGR